MWNLPSPKRSQNDLKKDITSALTLANGNPVYAIGPLEINRILNLYNQYNRESGLPCNALKGLRLSLGLRNALKDAYSQVQKKGRLQHLRDFLLCGVTSCPYCGFGEIKELDHYLPKADYKALAIYPKNLIPSCRPCNDKKRKICGELPSRQFFHSYIGQLPEEIFFEAAVSLSVDGGLTTKYYIKEISELDQDTYQRLCFQLDHLDLNNRYISQLNTFLTSLKTSLYLAYGSDNNPTKVQEFLEDCSKDHEQNFGLNDWRSAFLRGLSKCEDFFKGGFIRVLGPQLPSSRVEN